MSLNNFILECEKTNKKLTVDLNYYKNCSNRLLIENQQLKEKLEASEKAIVKAVEFIKENKNNLCYLENNIYHSKDDKLLNILDVDKGE